MTTPQANTPNSEARLFSTLQARAVRSGFQFERSNNAYMVQRTAHGRTYVDSVGTLAQAEKLFQSLGIKP